MVNHQKVHHQRRKRVQTMNIMIQKDQDLQMDLTVMIVMTQKKEKMMSKSHPKKLRKETMQLSKFLETGMLRNAVERNVMDIEENNSTPNQDTPVKIGTLKAHTNTNLPKLKVMKETSAEIQKLLEKNSGAILLTQKKDGKVVNQLLT